MSSRKQRRGRVTQTSEAAEVFRHRMRFNNAFNPINNTKEPEHDSESDSMLHPYSKENPND